MKLSKWQENGIILGLLILIFPFFGLTFYVQPQCDDFFFAMKLNSEGAFAFVKEMYLNWSGRYFSMFLGALDPWKTESKILLRIVLFSFQLLLISSLYFFLKSITTKNKRKKTILIFTLVFYTIFINTIPDILSLLYWYPSVSAYTIGISMFLLFLSFSALNYQNSVSNVKYVLLNSLLSILIIGTNELFIIPLGFASTLIIFIKYNNKKLYKIDLTILATIIIFALIMVLAPGNYKRMTWYNEPISLFDAYFLSIKSLFYIVAYYLQNPSFVLSSILLFIVAPKISNSLSILKIDISKSIFISSTTISVAFLSIILFPATYSLKCVPSFRVMDVLSFYFVFLWAINIYLFAHYLSSNFKIHFPVIINKALIVFILLSILSSAFITDKYKLKEGKRDAVFFQGNILEAYYTLVFEASTFDKEMDKRYKIFEKAKNNNIRTVRFKALTFQPSMLIDMPCKNVVLDSNNYVPQGIFLGERKYYNLDTLICDK